MKTIIEQRLLAILQPYLVIPLITTQTTPPSTSPYAELELIHNTMIGLGGDCNQSVDNEGNLTIRRTYRAEIAVRGFGQNAFSQLTDLTQAFSRITVVEQLCQANIGVKEIGTVSAKVVLDNQNPALPTADAELKLSIHYTILLNDTVGAIETIHAITPGNGNITIKITR